MTCIDEVAPAGAPVEHAMRQTHEIRLFSGRNSTGRGPHATRYCTLE
jgi:hypothetical protein